VGTLKKKQPQGIAHTFNDIVSAFKIIINQQIYMNISFVMKNISTTQLNI